MLSARCRRRTIHCLLREGSSSIPWTTGSEDSGASRGLGGEALVAAGRGVTRGAYNDSAISFGTVGKFPRGSLSMCNAILTGSQPTFLPVPRDCGCEPSFFGSSRISPVFGSWPGLLNGWLLRERRVPLEKELARLLYGYVEKSRPLLLAQGVSPEAIQRLLGASSRSGRRVV